MAKLYKRVICMLFVLMSCCVVSKASHLYGGELYYTWKSGNQYTVTIVIYGDCAAAAIISLKTATPEIKVYDGSSLYRTMALKGRDTGIEVTPVCTGSLGSTTCNGGTVPGVKKYVYSDTITLSKSSSWRFRFTGDFLNGYVAGRSTTITNIYTPGTSITSLEATLNNLVATNSNPTFTTVPTPFFCINTAQQYNQGAVDPNTGDSLVYELVTGLDGSAGGTVSYKTGYTATTPLATSTGTYSFNSATGQLNFTPNLAQISLVVVKVSEYRAGVLVGSCMREMNFIVLSTCSNKSPSGSISSLSGGTASGTTGVNICLNESSLSFKINPSDPDTNNITVTYAGLPSGATMTITGNGTKSPSCSFYWDIRTVAPGTYVFFMTYQDDACPLSSKQTMAYTINVYAVPAFTYTVLSQASCVKKAVFKITPLSGNLPWQMQVRSGTSVISTRSGISAAITDSLAPGTYTLRMISSTGCYTDTTITFAAPAMPEVQDISLVMPACYGAADGSITVSGKGGLSPYTYANGGGTYSSSGAFTALAAGSYVLHLRDDNMCVKDTSVVLSQPAVLTLAYAVKKPLCKDVENGAIALTAGGGTAPYTYAIGTTGTFSSVAVFSSLKAGTYTFRVKDNNNCITDASVTIADSFTVTASAVASALTCFGNASGKVTIAAGGGTAPYMYSTDGTSYVSGSTFSGLSAGVYSIYIRDVNGCKAALDAAVMEPAALTASVSIKMPACFDSKDGSITLDGKGGTSPYTYALNTGAYSSTRIFSSLDSGTYTLRLKDNNSCLKDTVVRLQRPDPLNFTFKLDSVATCIRKAVFRITPVTGMLPWDMTVLSGTSTVHTISGVSTVTRDSLVPGTYTLHMVNGNGCYKDTNITLAPPPLPQIQELTMQSPSCYGSTDGKITISGKSGLAPYLYGNSTIASVGSSGIFSGLGAGTYSLYIRDANSCIKDTSVVLSQPMPVRVSASLRQPMCKERSDGEVELTASGGSVPYMYSLGGSTFVASGLFTGLAAGTYTFRVKDKNNCMKDTLITLTDSIAVKATTEVTATKCYGSADGSISVSPSKGSVPYSYALGSASWTAGSFFGSLAAGTYTIRIRDAYGCATEITATVTQPTPLVPAATLVMPSCGGYSDGSISITGTGGSMPYTYAIGTAAFSASGTFTALAAGTYTLHIKDKNGCTRDTSIILTEPTALVFTTTLTSPLCNGYENGTALIIAGGGTPDYTYIAGDRAPQTDNMVSGLKAGRIVLQVRDRNGCIRTDTVDMTEPSKLLVSDIVIDNPTCEGYADGWVSLKATGGTPAYKYHVNNGTLSDTGYFIKLREGSYTLQVKDNNNCVADTVLKLKGYPPIIIDSTAIVAASCYGKEDGSFTLYASGGNPPLSYYFFATGLRSDIASYDHLAAGVHKLRVTDLMNCTKDVDVQVPQPDPLELKTNVVHNDCTGVDTIGRLSIEAAGGTAPYTFAWANGSGDSVIRGLANGVYWVTVTDAHQCTDSVSGEVRYDNCCTPAIPNAFTPNNDGKNDLFRILYRGDIVLKEFIIYNRYGQQVFATTDITRGWDGTFQGQLLDLGVYYYYIRMICGNNKDREVSYKGDVTLIR